MSQHRRVSVTPLLAATHNCLQLFAYTLSAMQVPFALGLYFIGEPKVFHEILQPPFHMKC